MPWFINWDDYKTNFEQEAGRILGHPVRVIGSANASILPSPSLTFTDVRVGPLDVPAMMTVDRFEVTIELMPLLQGEIRVTSMRLDKPSVRVAVDEQGTIDWLKRPVSAEALDPDKVVLSAVSISDGSIAYSDARTGVNLAFGGITAAVEARSLAGPWRADGSYIDDGTAVPFHLATGRRLDDGTIRLKTDASPAQWPVDLSADGVVSFDPLAGLAYGGTYSVSELVENLTGEATTDGAEAEPLGWRSEGSFSLTGERLVIDRAVLSNGPPERPTSLAGSLVLNFGESPSFEASAEARQLDLDRSLGGGPNQPVEVAAATQELVAWLGGLPIPAMPGRIAFDVPAIVVGGSVIQDVAFVAAPAETGWRIDGFRARLPGQASIAADGMLSTARTVGFAGSARLAVLQPATFASWWRGSSNQGAGRLLSAFDISGTTEISAGRIAVDGIDARIGDATITGRFSWSEAQRTWHRHLGTDLKADRIDFIQLKALAELLVGRDLTDVSVLADSYSVILAAEAFQFDDVRMTDVAVNAEYADDVLKIVRFSIGDIGGAAFKVTSGRIDELTTNMHGELTAELEAGSIDGLALVAGRFFPDSGLLEWLGRTADVITPAFVSARIVAPPEPGGTGFRISVEDGVAGATTFNVQLQSAASRIANWRDEAARISLVLDSPDSAALARQIGLAAVSADADSGAHVEIHGAGVPKDGLETTIIADFAGVTANASGALSLAPDFAPTFAGAFGVSAFDLGALIATAGLAIPGAAEGASVDLDGSVDLSEGRLALQWRNGSLGERAVNGAVGLSRGADGGWRVDGDLAVDTVDLGWLLSLGLGVSPLPVGGAETPWPKTPFTAPGYGPVSGRLAVAVDRLTVSETLNVANAKLALALQPQRIDVDLSQGHVAGGSAIGGFSVHNVEGNATLTGQFTLTGASLESLVWRLDERAVATGILDLSANFEATGSSPAGLISGMTGGGVVSVSEGEARYVDPTFAARQIIRASDVGQEFTEDALRITLGEQIDADILDFGEAGGAFTIAAGAVRVRGVSVTAPNKVQAAGNAVIDLNTMALDSDWTLVFDPGDTKVQGVEPRIGIVFRGPLARPSRIIDALPFGSYLNTRREARILEIIAQEEADRIEREWFARVALKLRQDGERAERLARAAAEAERIRREIAAAAGARLEALHVFREEHADELAAASLRRWAEQTVTDSEAASAAADAVAAQATAERERADTLAAGLPALVSADELAAAAVTEAAAKLSTAQAAAASAGERAANAAAGLEEAEQAAHVAADQEAAAGAAAETSDRDRADAEAALQSATASAVEARSAAEAAGQESAAAAGVLDEAGTGLSVALLARDEAAASLTALEAALSDAEAKAKESGAGRASAAQHATSATAERDRLQAAAEAAAQSAASAVAAREAAAARLQEAEAALAAAEAELASAAKFAADALGLAEAIAGDPDESEESVASARALATTMQLRQAARKAEVDRFGQEVELASTQLAETGTAADEAQAQAGMAQAALDSASAVAAEASAVAQRSDAANAALLNALTGAIAARDAAAQELSGREAAAQQAGAVFNEAEERARSAADAAQAARAAAETAESAWTTAASAVAASTATANTHRVALESAATVRQAAVERAAAAREAAEAANAAGASAQAALAEATAAYEQAATVAGQARTARSEGEATVAAALADAAAAETSAAEAAEIARVRAEAAEAAARHLSPDDSRREAVATPTPRPRRQPISLVPEALAGDQPMVIVPAP